MGPFRRTVGATFAISLTAWTGVLTLFLRTDFVDRLLPGLVARAAGSLVGGAFIHLLTRAIVEADTTDTLPLFPSLIAGFCPFYVLEAFLNWHHHHHHSTTHEHEPVSYPVLVSDDLDGLVIAAASLVAVPVGTTASLAVTRHEIPQEIGDFGVLVYGGFDRRQALVLNYCTQVAESRASR
jgi:zinc and cadmium transporter